MTFLLTCPCEGGVLYAWQLVEYDSDALRFPQFLLNRQSSGAWRARTRWFRSKWLETEAGQENSPILLHELSFGAQMCGMFRLLFLTPRIAPNTGNAIRMVSATGAELHLVEPLGFDLSEPKLRRAGLDYHDLASVTVHPDLAAAWDALMPARVYAFTAHAATSFADVSYRPTDVLMFGPEPTGLDAATLADAHISAQVRIPMLAGRRSLNLSNAAAVAAYEAWRQHGFAGAD